MGLQRFSFRYSPIIFVLFRLCVTAFQLEKAVNIGAATLCGCPWRRFKQFNRREGAEIVLDVPYAVIAKSVHIRFCIRHGLIRLF